jgi:threonine/homoserine/homoserine lactone efflux protein
MEWALAIIRGIGYGLFLGMMSFGPAFFALIQVGMQGGKKAGWRMATGIFLADLVVALACFYGLAGLFSTPWFQLIFAGFAASGILFMGVRGFVVKYRNFIENLQKPMNPNATLLQGFVVNLMNPFVILLWVGILGAITVGHDTKIDHEYTILVEMMSILLTVFSLDLGKVFLSDYIGRKLNLRIYYYFNKYVGLLLVVIGMYYAYHFVKLLISQVPALFQ